MAEVTYELLDADAATHAGTSRGRIADWLIEAIEMNSTAGIYARPDCWIIGMTMMDSDIQAEIKLSDILGEVEGSNFDSAAQAISLAEVLERHAARIRLLFSRA